MFRETRGNGTADERSDEVGDPPIEDLFSFDEDRVDYMSAGSFPASDPPPPQSMIAPPDPHLEGQHDEAGKGGVTATVTEESRGSPP
jgi:hypothetical protein